MTPKKAAIVSALILTVVMTAFQLMIVSVPAPEDKSFVSLRVDWSEEEIESRLVEAGFAEEEVVFLPIKATQHPLYVFLNTLGSLALLLFVHGWLKKKLTSCPPAPPAAGPVRESTQDHLDEPDDMFPNADL